MSWKIFCTKIVMSSENLHYKVIPRPFDKSLTVPSSKSHSNRSLILAALSPQSTSLAPLSSSSDTQTLLHCLEKMGLLIERDGDGIVVYNSFPTCERAGPIILETGDGGTTLRFLAALAARGSQTYQLRPTGSMKTRPLQGLIDALEQLGVSVLCGDDNALDITGPLRPPPHPLCVDCSLTTQFSSALMLALVGTGIPVEPVNIRSSTPYLAMTKELIRRFPQDNYSVPPDFSSLSYPLALAMSGGQVTIENCHTADPYQADSILLPLARHMGTRVEWTAEGLYAQGDGRPLICWEQNVADCPDLAPTLAFLASCGRGTSRMLGLDVLRHKESHRIREILRLLKAFSVIHSFDEQKSELTITGPTPAAPFLQYDPPEDHRIIMTAYLFMRKHSGGHLSNIHHVTKSFPNFFATM